VTSEGARKKQIPPLRSVPQNHPGCEKRRWHGETSKVIDRQLSPIDPGEAGALPRSPFDFAQGRLSTAVGMTPRGKGETGQAGRHKNEDGDVKIAAKAKPKMAP